MTSDPNSTPKYVVISPVRDEAEHIEHTIRSVVGQTIPPAQWIIVNDGSADDTARIVDQWASQHPWITHVRRADRGCRKSGSGVMEAFHDGLDKITTDSWDFLVKLDGDLSFEPRYFEQCFAEFTADPSLGIGGGVICHEVEGRLRIEPTPRFHVRGATKIYRRACWHDIGGLLRTPGWDTMDEVEANRLGWSTRSFPALELRHFRWTGAADGALKNSIKNGMGSYICGFHPLFVLSKTAGWLVKKPYLICSFGLLYGYVLGYIKRAPQVQNKASIHYLRRQQLRRLFFRATIWK